MKLLVTGGSGYIGAGILRRAPREWQIAATYLTHPIERADVAAFRLDICDADAVARVLEAFRPDVVIHTAAQMSGETMMVTNVDGTRNVARAAQRVRAHLIHLSTDVVFDGEHAPYNEDALPAPITPYGESKARAEQIVRAEHPRALIVRTSLVYGFAPMDPRTRQTLAGEMPRLFTDEYRCPIFIDDLADALIELTMSLREQSLLEAIPNAVLHIAGAQRLSRYEFGLKLARALHIEPKFVPALSASSPTPRPRDCTLDISRAQKILRTRLRGVDQVLQTNTRKS
ncbi:MAG: SDR family oxidoreductase [Anaerolineae bacterium]|nr:SDR family oxidoreductase [Anaerolineae bacterium]